MQHKAYFAQKQNLTNKLHFNLKLNEIYKTNKSKIKYGNKHK